MITVVGEALIDLVIEHDGRVVARPGGGPFNAARTIGRLALRPAFLGRLSSDSFGSMLRASLDHDGVTLAVPDQAGAPTALAAVTVDAARTPRFSFYLHGTSAAELDYPQLSAAVPAGTTALHVGSLALAMEPIASSIELLVISGVPADTLVLVDPNCRPQAIADGDAYRSRLARLLLRADVVKLSAEDLDYLYPGIPGDAAASALLEHGPGLVLMTDGPRPAVAFLRGQRVQMSIPPVRVVDTIGAGDAFGGAFLAWWSASELTRKELGDAALVADALRAAAEVAALTCTRAGADPPWLTELSGWPGRRPGPGKRQKEPLA
jgi:fructokinase